MYNLREEEKMIFHKIETVVINKTKKEGKRMRRLHREYWPIWLEVEEVNAKEEVGFIPNKPKRSSRIYNCNIKQS